MHNLKRCFKIVIINLILISAQLISQTIQWEQLNGPFGGTALSFASNSNGDLFAGSDQNQHGVFKSTDAGLTWLPKSSGIALADRAINWITIDDSGYVIAGTGSHIGNAVYKSKNNGESWTSIASGFGGTSVAVNDSGHIYVGNSGYGQYSVSKDGGYTWMHYMHPSPFINCIEINDSGHIFIGGNYTGYRSKDNGANWTTLSLPDGINSIAVAPNGNLFAGCSREYASNSGVYRSTDNGDSWTAVKEGFRVYASNNIVINTNGDIIVGSWGWGIWKSTDNGDTWTQHNNGLGHLYIKSMYISNDGNIYAGASGGGIYRSTDNGESWQQVGLTAAGVKALKISPSNGFLFAAVSGMARSTDSGENWQPINSGITSSDVRRIAIKSDGTIFIGLGVDYAYPSSFIFRSTDNGNTWTPAQAGVQTHEIAGLTVDDSNVYVSNTYGVYKSTNNGYTWFNIGTPPGGNLAFNSLGDLFLASWGGGFWKLPAGDTTWVNLTSNIGASWIWTIFIGSNNYIYAAGKRSEDNGETWITMGNTGSHGASSYAENSLGHLFCGTMNFGSGAFRSTNHGDTWEAINNGFPFSGYYFDIRSIAIDSEDYLYAGTLNYSMFKTTTPTVTSVYGETYTPISFSLEQNYPNPFNPSTTIQFDIPKTSFVSLKIYNLLGQEVATLVNEYKPAGSYEVEFSVAQVSRPELASGIYFYQLKADEYINTKKMLLTK